MTYESVEVGSGFQRLVEILSGANDTTPRGLWGSGTDLRKVGTTYCLWYTDEHGSTTNRYFRDPYHAVLAFLRRTGFPNRVWISTLRLANTPSNRENGTT